MTTAVDIRGQSLRPPQFEFSTATRESGHEMCLRLTVAVTLGLALSSFGPHSFADPMLQLATGREAKCVGDSFSHPAVAPGSLFMG
jgi:hypothetical protein